MGSDPSDLILSKAQQKFSIPVADEVGYKEALLSLVSFIKPDLIHFQNNLEIFHASLFRDELLELRTKLFMPSHAVIDRCVHKDKSYDAFRAAGIKIPENRRLNSPEDLKHALKDLSDTSGKSGCDVQE